MVAQMDEQSMKMVVNGLSDVEPQSQAADRSRGIVSCRLQKSPRYDHKWHHAVRGMAKPEKMWDIWDFCLVRDDGIEVFIHPEWKGTKIPCYVGEAPEDREIPRNGLGGSNGPGTFRRFKNKKKDYVLRFDNKKQ